MNRQAIAWVAAALFGIVLTAAVAWSASQLAAQRIGLTDEPLSVANGLAPAFQAPRHHGKPPVRHRHVRPALAGSTGGAAATSAPPATTAPATTAPATPAISVPPTTTASTPPATTAPQSSAASATKPATKQRYDGQDSGSGGSGSGSGNQRDD